MTHHNSSLAGTFRDVNDFKIFNFSSKFSFFSADIFPVSNFLTLSVSVLTKSLLLVREKT